jgi:hypothetical protein
MPDPDLLGRLPEGVREEALDRFIGITHLKNEIHKSVFYT